MECLTNKKVLTKGNYAIANAAVLAGCQCYFGYPITPQSEIGEFMSGKKVSAGGGNHCMEYLNKFKTLYLDCRNFQNCIFSA